MSDGGRGGRDRGGHRPEPYRPKIVLTRDDLGSETSLRQAFSSHRAGDGNGRPGHARATRSSDGRRRRAVHRVLVAFDGSPSALGGAATGRSTWPSANHALLTIAAVVQEPSGFWMGFGARRRCRSRARPCCRDLEREMRRHLAEARDEVPATVSVTTQLLHGRPGRVLAALAESGRYDLVVTGPRPLGRLRRLLRHSVTHGLLSRTRVSVLAVKAAVGRALQGAVRAAGQRRTPPNRTAMHNRQLHGALAAFVEEAAWQLAAETADGAEIPFEVVRGGRRDSPLYCYRPLTADFIEQRVGLLARLPSFLPAVHALSGLRPPGRLPRVARRARLPRRAARPRGVRPARVPQPRLRGLDRLRAQPRAPRARLRRGRVRPLRRAHRDGRHRAAARPRDRLARARRSATG